MLGARLIPLTPSHHQCEGRPPTLQASRAKRATHRAVASAACLEGRPGPVTPSTAAPDGQISRRDKILSSPISKNISLSPSGKSVLPTRPVPPRQEGRIAIVTNAGWDAVDAAASARKVIAGRVSRERAAGAQDERRWLRTAKPCGPDTRCWCQAAGGEFDPTGSISHQSGSDGDKTNSSPGRARHKP